MLALIACGLSTAARGTAEPAAERGQPKGEDEIDWATDERVPLRIFKVLFPGSRIEKHPRLRGIHFGFLATNAYYALDRMTFIETRSHGEFALVPIERSRLIRFSDGTGVVAFPVYLCTVCKGNAVPGSLMLAPEQEAAERGVLAKLGRKLLQFAFVDLKKNKYLGKPEGYPLETDQWDWIDQTGSWNEPLAIMRMEEIPACSRCVHLRYTRVDPPYNVLQVFALGTPKIFASRAYGEEIVQAEPEVFVRYSAISGSEGSIIAKRWSISKAPAPFEPDIPPGDQTRTVTILKLGMDTAGISGAPH